MSVNKKIKENLKQGKLKNGLKYILNQESVNELSGSISPFIEN